MSKSTYKLPFTDKEKVHQTDSLANCHLLYHSETWPPLSNKQKQQLNTAQQKAYRRALHLHNVDTGTHTTTDEVLLHADRLPLTDYIRPRRLRYLSALLNRGPRLLLRLLDCQWDDHEAWTTHITQDLHWLQTHLGVQRTTDQWIAYIRNHPKQFRNDLDRAWGRARRHSRDAVDAKLHAPASTTHYTPATTRKHHRRQQPQHTHASTVRPLSAN
jgi:hypothetical protein